MTRVLHLDSGPDWRGGQQQVFHLVAGLARRGLEQQLALRRQGALSQRATELRLPLSQLAFNSEADLSSILQLRRLIKDFCPDIIHAHDARTLGLAVTARFLGPSPKLIAARRVAFPISKNPFSRFKYQTAADRILAVSEFVRASLLASGVDPKRVVVIYDGLDQKEKPAEADRTSIRQRLGIPDAACLIGCVGSFTSEKGHSILIRGFLRINQRQPQSLLMLIGEGKLKDAHIKLAQDLGLAGKVFFPGFASDLSQLLPALDLFVFPSLQEGLGSSLLTAMAYGIPVCASRTGGIPEVVEDRRTGLLFGPGEPDSLAQAVLAAIEMPEQSQRYAQAAYQRVGNCFSVERMVEETHQIYSKVFAP